MSFPTSILMFAAGLGTRMAPLTDRMPKPLVKVAGRPLIDHALQFRGNLKVVVNIHAFADQMEAYLQGHNIALSDERGVLLETGGGLKRARELLAGNTVMTMNTDAVWTNGDPVQTLMNAWNPDQMEGLLLMIPRKVATGYLGSGDFDITADGTITKGHDFVYSGAQIIRTDRLEHITEDAFSMWSLWAPMLEAGTLYGTAFDGCWCDVGRPESIPLAENMLKGERVV